MTKRTISRRKPAAGVDMTPTNKTTLYDRIRELLEQARNQVVRNVNHTMVLTYFEIGRIIVEEEQQGKERAGYGSNILKDLSTRLTRRFGKGFSVENLDRMRFFFKIYSVQQISSTVLTKSEKKTSSLQTVLNL